MVFLKNGYTSYPERITGGGLQEKQDPADQIPKCLSIRESLHAAPNVDPAAAAVNTLKYGTMYLCSTVKNKTDLIIRWNGTVLIPVWALNVPSPCYKEKNRFTRRKFLRRSLRQSKKSPAIGTEAMLKRTYPSALSATISVRLPLYWETRKPWYRQMSAPGMYCAVLSDGLSATAGNSVSKVLFWQLLQRSLSSNIREPIPN